MKVVVQQVDLDTALTAYILGVKPEDEIVVVRNDAAPEDLTDPRVLCIEAGGSGQAHLGNFDHHNTSADLPPACRQALHWSGRNDPALHRLVDYAAAVDLGDPSFRGKQNGLTLSSLFSGMRLAIKDPVAQLKAGMAVIEEVLARGFDPFDQMPRIEEWGPWIEAKRREQEALAKATPQLFVSLSGRQTGFIETTAIGAIGALYELGCEVAVAFSPRFGDPPRPKYSIGGRGVRVDHLLPHLAALEEGWGGPGHGTIIASPRTGSRLDAATVIELVRKWV
jgi:hypothetical protein